MTTTTDFTANASDPDGHTVEADCVGRHICVHAIDPDGGVWVERFTTDDSGIRNADMLTSYCRTILGQWECRRRYNRPGPWAE